MSNECLEFPETLSVFQWKIENLIHQDDFDVMKTTKEIKENFLGWVKSGILLEVIKSEFTHLILRKKLAKNWKEYCLKFFNQSHWYTDRIIAGAKVVMILVKNKFTILPKYESQARHLVKFLPHPEYRDYENEYLERELCSKWDEVIKASQDQVITENLVLSIVDPEKLEQRTTNIRVPKKIKEKLQELALSNGYGTVGELLENFLKEREEVKEITAEQMEVWEEDLEELIKEHEEENQEKSQGFGGKQTVKKVEEKVKETPEQKLKFREFKQEVKQELGEMVSGLIDRKESLINPPPIFFNRIHKVLDLKSSSLTRKIIVLFRDNYTIYLTFT